MPRTLHSKLPGDFKTLPLRVEASGEGLSYQSLGLPLNFSQMLARRRPVTIDNPHCFSTELANLGVSVRLTLNWQGRDYWILVRQQRPDRQDDVLKLISGYVPAHEVGLPLFTAIQEIAEECLIESADGWLAGRFADAWLPTPYRGSLRYLANSHFDLQSLAGGARPVRCGALRLTEQPHAYVHVPTASLQLVYDMRLVLPRDCPKPSLYHVDERLEGECLEARLDLAQPDLYLLDPLSGELNSLHGGRLQPVDSQGLWLSEGFAAQEGWLIRDERVAFEQWRAQRQAAS